MRPDKIPARVLVSREWRVRSLEAETGRVGRRCAGRLRSCGKARIVCEYGKDGEDYETYRVEAEEDTRKPKPDARSYTPTKAEVYEHEVTHTPYRPW